ncbi:MAG: TonB-dependent receptor [Bryobacterales bacterium]|nr:TonB-dependent receptor [Bryobacterales bacterium]
MDRMAIEGKLVRQARISLMCLLLAAGAISAERESLLGGMAGLVTDAFGVPQMGATVEVLNDTEGVVTTLLSDKNGAFSVENLAFGNYSVRVKLASFLPALRRVSILPGSRPLLSISLANVFSSIELIYLSPNQRRFMSEDWKWVLRSNASSRPALRLLPDDGQNSGSVSRTATADTQGVVQVSAGDQGKLSPLGTIADLGTAFAVATSFYGDAQLTVSGNVGYGMSGTSTTGFETRYSPGMTPGISPEVRLSLKQAFLPVALGLPQAGIAGGRGTLSTMSASVSDRTMLSENLELQYGFAFDSVTYFDRLNYLSPYAKLAYRVTPDDLMQVSYSSGLPPAEMYAPPMVTEQQVMSSDLQSLALFPRVSVNQGRAQVQRITSYEIGYEKRLKGARFGVAAYHSDTRNAGVTMLAPGGPVFGANLLPDLLSNSYVLHAGSFQSTGGMVSAKQELGDQFELMVGYGTFTALAAITRDPIFESGNLHSALGGRQRHFAMMSATKRMRQAGTFIQAAYQWNSGASATAGHLFVTQRYLPQQGLSILLRQPLGSMPGMRGRLEATADLSNLLAEGYVPMKTPDGRQVVLVHTPRSVRGGLSFVF